MNYFSARSIAGTAIALFIHYPPAMAQSKFIPSGVYHWEAAPAVKSADREGRQFLEGTSPQLDYLEIHATTQYKGAVPKPPHAQTDIEEMIFIKEGSMKFTMGSTIRTLGKGSVVLIPPLEMQAIENVGNGPLTYYVMMFRSKKPMDMDRSKKAGGFLFLNADSLAKKPYARGFQVPYLDRPTAMCENLELHVTQLQGKGPSHEPHAHEDSELILMIDGKSEMTVNNKTFTASAGDFYIMNSGEMHGISNTEDAPCTYFALRWR